MRGVQAEFRPAANRNRTRLESALQAVELSRARASAADFGCSELTGGEEEEEKDNGEEEEVEDKERPSPGSLSGRFGGCWR